MLRLNLCSGQRKFGDGWINVDSQARWNPDVLADCSSMPMFENGSADIIVIHQGYEHFGLGEADRMVQECHRILCRGGSLIVTTPDLRALVDAWINGKIADYIFCVNLYGAYMQHESDRHRWLYTQSTLKKALAVAPWTQVLSFDWREIAHASIAKDWWIQGAECIK